MGRFELRLLAWTGALVLTMGVWTPARAQDADDLKRGVARISLMDGEVSVRRGDSGDWVAGVINAPLLADDRVSTGANSRAEVQFDSANILRIGGTAEVRITALEYGRYQMGLAHGTVTFRVLRSSTATVEVDTPNISVRPSKIGTYRISVNDAGETELMVRAGDVEVFTPRGSQWLNAGQMILARGTAADPEFQIVGANAPDEWDRWSDGRDRTLTQSTSNQYVPPGVYGAEDLDSYGSWENVPDYGYCWRPAVSAGWAPYSSGRWVWEDWYGWTWVSYDPWGWAPYHYGRWFWGGHGGWMWYPGVLGVRHYWSPALVGFFGFGGVGVGFGFGHVGWVPLAPYEVFHPWWGRSYYGRPGGFNHGMNITNVNITNVYRNARVHNGISAVDANDFRGGRFGNVMRPSMDQVRSAGMVRGQMPMSPTNANLRFSDRQSAAVPRSNENMRFFQHQQPATAQRVPFAQQRGAEQGNRAAELSGNRPVEQGNRPSGNVGGGAASAQVARPNAGGSGGSGWRRFGEPAGQSGNSASGMPSRAESNGWRGGQGVGQNPNLQNTRPSQPSGGWQRFGEPSGSRNSSNPGGGAAQYGAPGGNGYSRMAPSVVRERSSGPSYGGAPSYSSPQYGGGAPGYSAPRSNAPSGPSYGGARNGGGAPNYSAPRSSAPSAPRSYGGGGGGGGGSHPSGGGGGGGGSHSSGGHGGRR